MQAPFLCPVCGLALGRDFHSYSCPGGHCFDIAKSGYVNLLRSNSAGRHGDDKLMVLARKQLLDKGYYAPLAGAAATMLANALPAGCTVLDAGCGEGYYTQKLEEALLENAKQAEMIGIDISKDAVNYAAKRSKSVRLAVASSAELPFGDASLDCITNIFSPLMQTEFSRCLKPGGYLLRIVPLERHLWELKALIYDKPYENDVPSPDLSGFSMRQYEDICYSIKLPCNEDIMNLFRMTPYYYKTGKGDQEKAKRAEALEVSLAFRLYLYMKE